MSHGQYILVDGLAVLEPDLMRWALWMKVGDRLVAHTHLGDVLVSTVFLGLDHQWASGPPLLYETMIFGGPHHRYQERYATREQAEKGHAEAVALAEVWADALPVHEGDET